MEAKYIAISRKLKDRIKKGVYRSGGKLPGEMETADMFGVSRVTSRQALALLEEEGYVTRRRSIGTIVNDLRDDRTPVKKLEHVAFMFVDVTTRHDYQVWEIAAAERWLAGHGITLSIAHLSSENVARGEIPPVFSKGLAQAVLLDGRVQDVHCLFVSERLELPFLVAGHHPIKKSFPQIKYAVADITRQAVDTLERVNPGKPIFLLLEPFDLTYTKELFAAYNRAVQMKTQKRPILQTCEKNDGYTGLKHLLDQGYRDFSLITTDIILHGVLQAYREKGISADDHPIVTIGNPRRIPAWERELTYLAPWSAERITLEAVNLLTDIYETGRRNVYEELALDIEPPQKQGGAS